MARGRRLSGQLVRLRDRDGSWRDGLLSAEPMRGEAGGITGALVIIHDVTETREAQRLKDELLATASHELRTPLTTIKAMTQVLLRTLQSRGTIEPEQLAACLERIHEEADRLTRLGIDLLDVSRLHHGRLPLRAEPHDLNAVVRDSLARFEQLAALSTRHRLTLDLASQPLSVSIERARIEQVLTNLLDNAVKYSPAGGAIAVTTEERGAQACVRISDSGIGVPAGDVGRLFSPFFRGTNVTAQHYPGRGLGLYLSREIVDAHGGALCGESVEGQGSTFTLTLPRLS